MKHIKINIFFLVVCLHCSVLFCQNKDSAYFKTLFFEAEGLEISNPDSATILYQKVIQGFGPNTKNKYVGAGYHRLAELEFRKTNNFKNYFKNNFKAIKIFESIHDSTSAMMIYQNQSIALSRQNRFEEAIADQTKVYHFAIRNNKPAMIVSSTMSIAECYSSLSQNDTALAILLSLEKQFLKTLSDVETGTLYSNIGNTYFNAAESNNNLRYYGKAIEYAEKALLLFDKQSDDPSDKSFALGLLGAAYLKLGKIKEAEPNYIMAIKIEEELNHITDLNTLYLEMAELQIKLLNKPQALNYLFKYDSIAKLIYNENNANSISEMKTLFETEKKDQENKSLALQNKLSSQTIKQQKLITYFTVGGFLIVSFLAFFIFKGLKKQRKANAIIAFQKQEVQHQKELVDEKQKEILDSIHYAKRIQAALLANKDLVDKNLPENFILFKPKDIVSGDFYWATEHDNKFYLAICDSTGHGVPGAFMSLLNIGFLSEAIKEKNIDKPNEIFNYVRNRLISSISNEGQKDGMDGILICWDIKTRELTYAAANNEPILISNNQIMELPKDRMPVGKGENEKSFGIHTVKYQAGDTLYLYTDGYADQFGGPKGKKFKYKQLNELLLSVSNSPLAMQAETLNLNIEKWKGDLEQVDDICIVGIKL